MSKLFNPEGVTEDQEVAFHNALKFVEEQFEGRGSRFLDGPKPGFADYMIWPWFERLEAFKEKIPAATIDRQKYKLLVRILLLFLLSTTVFSYIDTFIVFVIFFLPKFST